jgi:chromosome segregation ATPase
MTSSIHNVSEDIRAELEGISDTFSTLVDEANNYTKTLEEGLDEALDKVNELEGDIKTLQAEVSDLEAQVNSLELSIENYIGE